MTITTPLSLHSQLKHLLERNHLLKPNRQPLYQYQLTKAEYAQLKDTLQQYNQASMDEAFCAAFCLFCSEWFRREYQGGWSWEPIWELLGYRIDANDRSDVVKKGLKYWQRSVIQYSNEHHSYLGSVFREGGLPYQLLSDKGDRMQEIFKKILRDYDETKLMGHSVRQLVDHHLQPLPEAFKQETTVALVVEMVERLVRLVDHHQLGQQEDPARFLDDRQAGWRRLFPIPMDEQTGSAFLGGLLSSASEQYRSQVAEQKPIVCQHTLQSDYELVFQAKIKLADAIVVPLTREQLSSSRVELHIAEGNRSLANLIGYVQFKETTTKIKPRSRIRKFLRREPQQPLALLIKQAGQILLNIPIENSQLAIGEVPVGLRKKDDRWQVCGSASFSYKAEQLLVLLPDGSSSMTRDAKIHREENRSGYQLLYFSGILEVEIKGDQYRLSSQSSASFTDQVRIEGPTLTYSTRTGQPVYLGMPEIRCDDSQTQLWVGEQRYVQAHCSSFYGVQTVKLKSPEGLTLFHRRLAILPRDFSISLQSGKQPNQGALLVQSAHNFVANIETRGVTAKQVKQSIAKHIDLQATDMPPMNVTLVIYANLMATPIKLQVPFPAQGVLAFNSSGDPLARELVIEDLLGSRLQLFPRLGGKTVYSLELLADSRVRGAHYEWSYQVHETPIELGLYELRHYIRALFAVTPDDLDAQVRLRISGEGSTQTFMVKHYACVVESENFGISISADHPGADKHAEPVLIELTDPKMAPRPLTPYLSQGVKTGRFALPSVSTSPCLIVPSRDSELCFRAKFVPGNNMAGADSPITSLYKAVEVFHPVEKPTVIFDVITHMVGDFKHSGWQYLIDLFEQFDYLPLSTFEVWKAISKHEEALCILAFRLEQAPVVMERLQQEFNVLWEWLPLSAWRTAYQAYSAHWRDLDLPDKSFSIFETIKFDQLAEFAPLFDKSSRSILCKGAVKVLPKAEMSGIVKEIWYQDLMRLHADDNKWPIDFSFKLNDWYQQLPDCPLDIEIHMPFHKSVVILPIFAAAVVTGSDSLHSVVEECPLNTFIIRQILEFDRHWFIPVYQYCLTYFTSQD